MKVMLVVKKHPDGYHYVPFDHDDHPSREGIVAAYVAALVDEGHVLERVEGSRHREAPHPLDFHYKLVSGPRSHLSPPQE